MADNLFKPGDKVVRTGPDHRGCKTGGVYAVECMAGTHFLKLEEFGDRWFLQDYFRDVTSEESTEMKPNLDLTKPFASVDTPDADVTFLSDKGPSERPLVFKVKTSRREFIVSRRLDGTRTETDRGRIVNKVVRTSKFANIYANSSFTRNLSFVLHGTKELADKYHEARRIAVLEAIYEDGVWVDVVLHKVNVP